MYSKNIVCVFYGLSKIALNSCSRPEYPIDLIQFNYEKCFMLLIIKYRWILIDVLFQEHQYTLKNLCMYYSKNVKTI